MGSPSDLGSRMKNNYEVRAQTHLPRRTNTIIRLDGKAFHTYTRGRAKPWDPQLHENLCQAAKVLCEEAQGAVIAYIQSDEISLLLTDYVNLATEAWFDGNVQKMVSVSASIVTAAFNLLEDEDAVVHRQAYFDARVFTIPEPIEVHNYFVWRQRDAERNSLASLCQAHFSSKQLEGKKREDQHELLHSIGLNWNDEPANFKRGSVIVKVAEPDETWGGWSTEPAPEFSKTWIIPELLGWKES